jgi:hypothetical protein
MVIIKPLNMVQEEGEEDLMDIVVLTKGEIVVQVDIVMVQEDIVMVQVDIVMEIKVVISEDNLL